MAGGGAPEATGGLLRQTVYALEQGDWRTAMETVRRAAREPTGTDGALLATLKVLTHCQIWRSTGNCGRAVLELDTLARRLAGREGLAEDRDGRALVQLTKPPIAHEPQPLLWLITRLVWREQTELSELLIRTRRAEERRDVAGIAVLACIEYLGWVDHDPWTWRRPSRPPPAEFFGQAEHPAWFTRERDSEIRLLATSLRQSADPRKGDISRPVIYDAGGFRGLCERAMEQLAERDQPAWRTVKWDVFEVPSRRGSVRAWKYARQWSEDSDLGPVPA